MERSDTFSGGLHRRGAHTCWKLCAGLASARVWLGESAEWLLLVAAHDNMECFGMKELSVILGSGATIRSGTAHPPLGKKLGGCAGLPLIVSKEMHAHMQLTLFWRSGVLGWVVDCDSVRGASPLLHHMRAAGRCRWLDGATMG